MGKYRAALLLVMLLGASAAYASTQEDLRQVGNAIAEAEAKKKALEQQRILAESEMRKLQETLVEIAAKLQETEQNASDLESQLAALEAQENTKSMEIALKEKDLQDAISRMVVLSRMPPETALLMPGESHDALLANHILRGMAEQLKAQADALGKEVAAVTTLRQGINARKAEVDAVRAELEKNRAAIASRVGERSRLFETLGRDSAAISKELAELSQKSRSLQELLERVENARAKRLFGFLPIPSPQGKPTVTPSPVTQGKAPEETIAEAPGKDFNEAKGRLRLPAFGKVLSRFGTQVGKNMHRKGITVATREGAQVVSPFDGEVVFTGPFLGYGKLVILKHGTEYHTLIAGLTRIDCEPGQVVVEGEPVGVMGSGSEDATTLYVELRKNSKPIDPGAWFDENARNISG